MGDIGIHQDRVAGAQPMAAARGVDLERASQAVNHHVTRRAVLRESSSGFEREQKHAQRASMGQSRLPVTLNRGMWLRVERAGEVGKIERHHRSGETSARVRPQPLRRLGHAIPGIWHEENGSGMAHDGTAARWEQGRRLTARSPVPEAASAAGR